MKKILALALVCSAVSSLAYAETAEEKGLWVANEVDSHDLGWGDVSTNMKMLLRNRQGEESERIVRIKALEIKGDGDKTLTIFDRPTDVKNTAFLSYSHAITADDQWLFMPALKRTKRISSANKSGPFMGSQFAYEDLTSFEVEKYKYKYLKDDVVDGSETYVIENHPQYEHSGYTRLLVWVDKMRFIPLKVEYYDRKDTLLKTLKFQKYSKYLGEYWRAHEQYMENHQNGKTTLLSFSGYKFKQGFSGKNFNRNSLKRAR